MKRNGIGHDVGRNKRINACTRHRSHRSTLTFNDNLEFMESHSIPIYGHLIKVMAIAIKRPFLSLLLSTRIFISFGKWALVFMPTEWVVVNHSTVWVESAAKPLSDSLIDFGLMRMDLSCSSNKSQNRLNGVCWTWKSFFPMTSFTFIAFLTENNSGYIHNRRSSQRSTRAMKRDFFN